MKKMRVAFVTPYPWQHAHAVNDHVSELASALCSTGAQVMVIAPSAGFRARNASRRAIRQLSLGEEATSVFGDESLSAPEAGDKRGEPFHNWPLLTMSALPGATTVTMRAALRTLFSCGEIDVLNFHEPLENEFIRHAIKTWQGMAIATVHSPPDPSPLGPFGVAKRERLLDNIDHWIVSSPDVTTALKKVAGEPGAKTTVMQLFAQHTPTNNPYQEASFNLPQTDQSEGRLVVVGRGDGDERHVRALLKSLAEIHPIPIVMSLGRWTQQHRVKIPRAMKGKFLWLDAGTRTSAMPILESAHSLIATPHTNKRLILEAHDAGVTVIEMQHGTDKESLAQSASVVANEVSNLSGEPTEKNLPLQSATQLANEFSLIIEQLLAAVHPPAPSTTTSSKRPPSSGRGCLIDLHMHTSHSWDCATTPETLLQAAVDVGLTAIAVTDHNEISGALECAAMAEDYGIQVIVGEEVKTSEGEVIGLFLKEKIEKGMSWHETIDAIRTQDGLVYVPHPFDRMHTIPDVATLRDTLDQIDLFEVYNARLAFEQFNRDAQRFATKYNLTEGAGSDAHVPQGLGTAAVHMPEWDDPESFLVALRQGEIIKRPKSLVYLQGLKLLDTVTGRTKA